MGTVAVSESMPRSRLGQSEKIPLKKHVLVGTGAGLSLIGAYFGILTLVQGAEHALSQTASLWYWILALAIGFGTQSGMLSFIRQRMRERRASTTATAAASGGISAGSMIACCTHHFSEVLPFLGIAGLSAFLTSYQTFFLVVGVLANAVGITVMLETIQRHNLCPVTARLPVNMARVKLLTLISSVAIGTIVFVLT